MFQCFMLRGVFMGGLVEGAAIHIFKFINKNLFFSITSDFFGNTI